MTEHLLDVVMHELTKQHPGLEPGSDTLKNLIRDSEFTPEQVFAISLLAAGISRDTSAFYISPIEKQVKVLKEAFDANSELGQILGEEINKLRDSLKNVMVNLVDALNSQFEAADIPIKINLEIV